MKILKRGLVILITCAFILTSLGANIAFAEGEDPTRATGLAAPGAEDVRLFNQQAKMAIRILPNKTGLERINETRLQLGLEALPGSYAVRNGDEAVTSKNTGSMEKKYGATMSLYGDILGALPPSVDNSESIHFPAIGDQGNIGSCSSFATTYYAATYETARARGINLRDDPGRTLSPRFTYNLCNDGMDFGSAIYVNILTMMDHGAPFTGEASMPGYQYNGYDPSPLQYLAYPVSAEIWRDALKNKLAGAVAINDTDTPTGLANLKEALNNGHVLVFGTDHVFDWRIEKRVANDPATNADDAFTNQYIAYGMVVDNEYAQDGHAMTIVGYNDDIWVDMDSDNTVDTYEKGAFKIANSWGDYWNDGYIWLGYDALTDAHGHRNVIAGSQVIYLEAQAEYTPKATADITVTTSRRDKLSLMTGMNWNEAKGPASYMHDYVFDGGWGGPYSLAGTDTESTGTIVVDMSDAADGMDYEGAGGALTLSAGVGDTVQSDEGESQTVTAVAFRAGGKTYSTVDTLPSTIYHGVEWFDGKGTVNTEEDPLAYDQRVQDLETLEPDTPVHTESAGSTDIREWQYTPAQTGTYSFANGVSGCESRIRILNEACKVLHEENFEPGEPARLTACLYAGKTYVLQTCAEGTAGGAAITAVLHLEAAAPASGQSAKLTGLALSGQSLDAPFDPDTLNYRSVLTGAGTTLSVTPEDGDAYILIDGKEGASREYTLEYDSAKLVRVDVTSKDWQKTRTYRVVLSYGEPSTDATLSGITLSYGTLEFDPDTTEYSTTYPATTDGITLTASQADPNATTIINGSKRSGITLDLHYGDTADVNIKVTAEDLATTRTYTVHVGKEDLNAIGQAGNAPLYDALKAAYPAAVDADNDLNITAHELRQLSLGQTTLDLSGREITDISGLHYCTGLASLNLSGNSITALPDLSALKDLNTLDLGNNQLTDLAGVEGMSGLKTLKAGGNHLTDIGALSGLDGLQSLDVQGNRISSIEALSGMSGLYSLNLKNNYISSIAALQHFGQGTGRAITLDLTYNLLNPASAAVTSIISHLPAGTAAYSAQKTFHTHFYPGAHASIGAATPYNGLFYESYYNYYYGQYEPIPYVRPDSGYHLLGWDTNGDGLPEIPRGQNILMDTVPMDGVHRTSYNRDVTAVCAVIPPGLNGRLFSIAYTSGTLSPAFDSNTFYYTLLLDKNTASTVITPIKINLENKMTVAGSSRATSKTVSLSPGKSTTVKIVVYETSRIKRTYSVYVSRAPSTDDTLSSMSVSRGTMDKPFANGTPKYTVTVPEGSSSAYIRLYRSSSYATTYIDNRKATSKTVSVPNGQTRKVTVRVRAQAGNEQAFEVWFVRPGRVSSFSATPTYLRTPSLSPQGGNTLTFKYRVYGTAETRIEIYKDGIWRRILTRTEAQGSKSYAWDGRVDGEYLLPGTYSARIYSMYEGTYLSQARTLTVNIYAAPGIGASLSTMALARGKKLSARISWNVPTNVSIQVVDGSGNVVTTLYSKANCLPSARTVYWYGKIGRTYAAPGTYRIRVTAGGTVKETEGFTLL